MATNKQLKTQNTVLWIVSIVVLVIALVLGGFLLWQTAFHRGQEMALIENPVIENPVNSNSEETNSEETDESLIHLAYWTTATKSEDWPDMRQFSIVACHNDPDTSGNAKIVFLIGNDIKTSDLQLTYFNGYTGEWNETVKNRIIREIEDSVKPHVPGFNLSEIEIININ